MEDTTDQKSVLNSTRNQPYISYYLLLANY